MKGLQGDMMFTNLLTESERKVVKRLAEIEQEDADRCAHCGGEDCICCEYYLDRQKWQSPEELFGYADNTEWEMRELMGYDDDEDEYYDEEDE